MAEGPFPIIAHFVVHIAAPVQLQDKYGSPSMDEVADFARGFYVELEASLGEEAAGAITVEVSSAVLYTYILLAYELCLCCKAL